MSQATDSPTSNPSPEEQIFAMYYFSSVQSRCISASAELGIADILAQGPLSVAEIAQQSSSHEDSVFRMLRTLVSLGVFIEVSPRVFENNALSSCLRRDIPGSQWAIIRQGAPGWPYHTGLAEMMRTLKTGETAVNNLWGHDLWEYYRRNPDQWTVFNESMGGYTAAQTPPITAAYDWSQFPLIADVGGGIGTQLVDILNAHPDCHGVVCDLAEVVAEAIEHERMEAKATNFFQELPSGPNAYLLRSILHDWDDEACLKILKTVSQAASPNAKVLVVDCVVPETDEFHFSKILDMTMMLTVGGKERTASELKGLFEAAGIEFEEIVATATHFSIVIGKVAS